MDPISSPPYKIACPGPQLQLLRDWARRASELNILDEYLAALKAIDERLTTNPVEWGDPQNNLRYNDMVLYHGIRSPLRVYYTVDAIGRVVIVKEFRLLPGQGLEEEA